MKNILISLFALLFTINAGQAQTLKKLAFDSLRVNKSFYVLDASGDTNFVSKSDFVKMMNMYYDTGVWYMQQTSLGLPRFKLMRNPASMVPGGTVGQISFIDSLLNAYADILVTSDDTSSGNRAGSMWIRLPSQGSIFTHIDIDSGGVKIPRLHRRIPVYPGAMLGMAAVDTLQSVWEYGVITDDAGDFRAFDFSIPPGNFGEIDSVVVIWTANSTDGDSVSHYVELSQKSIGNTFESLSGTGSAVRDTVEFDTDLEIMKTVLTPTGNIKETYYTNLNNRELVLVHYINDTIDNDMADDVWLIRIYIYYH